MARTPDRIFSRLLSDECGAATTEYVVVVGLVILGVVAVLLEFGPRLMERWGTVAQRLGGDGSTTTGVANHSAAHPS